MLRARAGGDPVEERRQSEEQKRLTAERERDQQRRNLGAVLDRYVEEHGSKRWRPDTLREIARVFQADLKPLRSRPIADITRRDVRELLDAIVARGRAPHAHHVLAYFRPALGWAREKEFIDDNPAEGIADPDPRRQEARTRDRFLDDDEVRVFWPACDKIGWPYGAIFKLLLLTGQRRDELGQATWPEFDLDRGHVDIAEGACQERQGASGAPNTAGD
jgi:integrase